MQKDESIYMQSNKIVSLRWDSQFFGYDVAQIIFDQSGNLVLNDLLQEIKSQKIHLTYLFVPPSNTELNRNIIKKGGILVDEKTLFSKKTEPHSRFRNEIVEFNGTKSNEKLIELVLHAGQYSRFSIDKNFKNKEFERLYTQWLLNSINKAIAFKTIIAGSKNNIIGITTIGQKKNCADIGLVSVDKNFSGKGIGTDLVNFADNIAYEMKYDVIKVVTQLKNSKACNLYQKCNFNIESITNVYHFWQPSKNY